MDSKKKKEKKKKKNDTVSQVLLFLTKGLRTAVECRGRQRRTEVNGAVLESVVPTRNDRIGTYSC